MKRFEIVGSEDLVTQSALARLTMIPRNSVLVVVRSGILSRTLPVAINAVPVTVNQDMRAFIPHADVSARYLAWQLIANEHDILGRCAKDGTTVASIDGPALASYPMAIAPAAEQCRVVEKLEDLLSELDAAVAGLKTAQRKLAQYRQSLLKAAVEGALTADWRAAREARGEPQESGAELLQRILAERRARWEKGHLGRCAEQGKQPARDWQVKYAEPTPPSLAGLCALPTGWIWVTAEQVCGFITKGTTPPKAMGADAAKQVPFLRVTNLTGDGTLNLSDRVYVSQHVHQSFLRRSVVYPSDVLMNIVGPPLGQVSIATDEFDEWNINQAIAIFRPLIDVSPSYLLVVLLSSPIQRWLAKRAKTTAGQTNLTLELCRALPLPLPPLEEQVRIVELLAPLQEDASRQFAAIARSLKQAAAQRKNILKAAFAGKLVPQDPTDEPASALLDRIRTRRDNPEHDSTQLRRTKQRKRSVESDA